MESEPLVVVWRVTERCNLSCGFCAYDRRLTRTRREADPQMLVDFGAVLAHFARETGRRVLVSWLGGEPLLWRPLREITRRFRDEFGLSMSVTTNGTVLGEAGMRADLLSHYAELTVSVDGLGSVHDVSRGWANGFDKLREGVRALTEEKRVRRSGPVFRANVLLMRSTIAQFAELCRELATWGIEEITFNQLGGTDRPEFFPEHRLLTEQVTAFAARIPALREELNARGVRLMGSEAYLSRLIASTRDARISVGDCLPGETFLFIDEAGIAAPCSFTAPSYGVPLSEISTVAALRALPEHFRKLRRCRRDAACEDCHSTRVFEKFAA